MELFSIKIRCTFQLVSTIHGKSDKYTKKVKEICKKYKL